MAYDEQLAERVRAAIGPGVAERRMFGGLGWMLAGNMACGVMSSGGLLVRVPPEAVDQLVASGPHVGRFGREGAKPMSGFVLVHPAGVEDDGELERWIGIGLQRAAELPPK